MKKLGGFTLIELIVVIAIVGILAAILVPTMMSYIRNARATEMNANAKEIYNATQLAINDCNIGGSVIILPNHIYTGSDDGIAHPSGGGDNCDLTDYLGKKFGGYFLFVTNHDGTGCNYALWSKNEIHLAAPHQMTPEEVKSNVHSPSAVGCHPLKVIS